MDNFNENDSSTSPLTFTKSVFTSGNTVSFIKTALNIFSQNDEISTLSALTELASELSMANDSVGEDRNFPELIKQLIILLDKYPLLPDISLWSINCINYLLDINPRSSSTVSKYDGIEKIVQLTQNVEFIDCVESAIKTIEKMSYETVFNLIEKNAFANVLTFIDFFDLNLRKTALKACVNMAKYGNTLSSVNKYFIPAVPVLTTLTKLCGNSEMEKNIVVLSVQCFYYLILGTKKNNHSKELNEFCDEICKYGLLDNLYELFQSFIEIEENNTINKNNAKINVSVETIKYVLMIFQMLSSLSDKVTNYLLQHGSLKYIYTVLDRELANNKQNELKENDDNQDDDGIRTKKSKLNSSSHSLYNEIFNLLISFFPSQTLNNKKENEANNNTYNKIMNRENKDYYLYFSKNILKLLIDNIVHIPSSHTTLCVIQLITMYCTNSPNDNIINYINNQQLSNTLSKMLDSRDSSYILAVLLLLDILMRKIPHHFFIDFLRQGVVDNIKKLSTINDKDIFTTKETNIFSFKNSFCLLNDPKISSKNELVNKKTSLLNCSSIQEIIRLSTSLINEIYFSTSNINALISQTKFEKGELNPVQVMEKLNEFKERLKKGENNIHSDKERTTLFKELIDMLTKCKVTFFEIEKSDIIFVLCSYLDSNFALNHSNAIDTDTQSQVTLSYKYDRNIINKLISLYKAFNSEHEQVLSFLSILQRCISSMNCFKLCLYEYDNIKTTANVFLNAFNNTKNFSLLKMIYSPKDSDPDLIEHSKKMGDSIKKIIDYYTKETKGIVMSVDLEKTFEELKENLFLYPIKKGGDKDDTEDEYIQELFKLIMGKKSNEGDNGEGYEHQIPPEFLKKILERKRPTDTIAKKPQQDKQVSEEKPEEKEKADKVLNENVIEFFKLYDVTFWIDLPNKTKFEISSRHNIYALIKEIRKQSDNFTTIISLHDLKINFAFAKRNSNRKVSEITTSTQKKQLLPIMSYNKDLYVQLFEFFYDKTIVNNEDTYNIKRASPFFYLITLIELSHNYFSSFFNVQPISNSLFENFKMTSLLSKQIRDPQTINGESVPSWCKQVNSSFPFFTNFSSRYILFKTTSFEKRRSMINLYVYLNKFLGENILEDKSMNTLISNFTRIKVTVSRDAILEKAFVISNQLEHCKDYIEYEYANETGTGMGPTLEFYSLFFKAISQEKFLWYKTEDLSLFPMPVIEQSQDEIKLIQKRFHTLGFVIARALYDDRLIDIPLNSLFWDLVLGRPFSFESICKVDKYIGNFIIEQLEHIKTNKYPDYDSMDIYFTLPWNDAQSLIPKGDQIKLKASNINQYIYETFNKLLLEGQQIVIKAFTEGFNKVFDINNLRCFASNELVDIVCGSSIATNVFWTYEHLVQNIIPSHGFNKDSLVYKGLIDILMKMTNEERKMFLLFVTGAPRLPIGGFKNLYPKLTVVMFQSEQNKNVLLLENDNPDKHLPSVMTCQNYLKIPNYSSVDVLKEKLFIAIKEGNNAFHLS